MLLRLGLTMVALVAIATAADPAFGSSSGYEPQGSVRPWGGTFVRSLDPPRIASAAQAIKTTPAPGAPQEKVLSNERTLSRWAYTDAIAAIRTQPAGNAPRIARTRWYTEDGFPEVYLLLSSRTDSAGYEWVNLRIPMRPNGRTGWVRREALSDYHVTSNLLVVDRQRLRMYLYRKGRFRWSAPVGVGARSTPTPAGRFWIRERFKILNRSSGYWPYAFGTADYSTLSDWPGGGIVGIHGPYGQPGRIPGRPSHGCIRMRTRDDSRLARDVGVGTPLRVI